ncbi:LacI family DNA-binding transcriptional regulator [Companilactobacillus bobalius]|nr:LacI family DNA-binding transcriptional regulator [Companilactobacillus bobalius]KAE9564275.1 LacI family transcriptional regulator [Companilactobacillus bobalius]OVE97335.1 putative HTH-type transcriptional repressor ExuR [Companilactobacillus bobalius]GEO58278.1 LacI family transcriptional regulator [Companilactobacillus paralimentarius]
MAHITIKEIAKLSGTSVSTVSRVLNNSPSVSPAKRAKIKNIIEQTHFQPSMLARGMVSRKTNTLAVVISDINNPYFTDLLSQIGEIAHRSGYTLLLINTMTAGNNSKNSVQIEIDAFQSIEERKVDGVLILGGEIDKEEINKNYIEALNILNEHIPVVIIGQKVNGCNATFVERNQSQSVSIITRHLLALGHKNLAFIGGQPGIRVTSQRVNEFKKVLNIYSPSKNQQVILTDFYTQSGYDAITELLNSRKPLPEAIVAINDQVAFGAIRCLQDHQIEVPTDIALGSCDEFPGSEFMIPRITTVNQHNEKLGKIALFYLFNLIENKDFETIETNDLPELIIRESCGAHLLNK